MRDYHDLDIWQKAHELTLRVYKLTEHFPKEETYGLSSQLRRAAYSIPMNLAEGCGRSSQPEFARFLDIAAGSASELDYQMLLAKDLGFIDEQGYEQTFTELSSLRKMLTTLINRVRSNTGS